MAVTIIEEPTKCRIKAPLCPVCQAPMIEFHYRAPRIISESKFIDGPPETITQIAEYFFVCRMHRNQRHYLGPDELRILNKYTDHRQIVPEK